MFHKGRHVRLEMAMTYATALTLAAGEISQADPGVLTHAAHGFANGDVGLFSSMVGMEELEGQAMRAANIASGTLELEGIDTTDFAALESGSLAEVATWATIAQSSQFVFSGGGIQQTDITVLLDYKDKSDVGSLTAESCKVDMYADPKSPGIVKLRKNASKGVVSLFRATYLNEPLASRLVVLWAGIPGKPDFGQNVKEVARASFDMAVKGEVLYL